MDHDLGMMPAGIQLPITGDERDSQPFCQRQVHGVVAGVLSAQRPYAIGEERGLVPVNNEIGIAAASTLGSLKGQDSSENHAAQGGEDLNIKDMGSRKIPRNPIKEGRVGIPANQYLDHR